MTAYFADFIGAGVLIRIIALAQSSTDSIHYWESDIAVKNISNLIDTSQGIMQMTYSLYLHMSHYRGSYCSAFDKTEELVQRKSCFEAVHRL